MNKIIIVGGGSSLREFPSTIWDTLSNQYTLGCNFSYKDFTPTSLVCVDGEFYNGHIDYSPQVNLWNKYNPEHRKRLSELPLIIAQNTPQALAEPLNNTLFVKTDSHTWNGEESVLKGFFCHSLTGHLALSLACYLLNFIGEIYLLGFDSNVTGNTHYYNHTDHRGVGYTRYYHDVDLNTLYKPYLNEKGIMIYNVSVNSKIEIFKKISPQSFLRRIEGDFYNQNILRDNIKSKLII